ncbi:hypothetical protein C4K35_3317 [Pseudomonas chlororaphis subsp. piscium]|nr:hypothetical protein C4K35_3317 [Pseudomonas chlororaphis subsp. piscium]AZC57472.1 hypothetical protein C4K34_3307 [Pseudomonas chlororaphis subsp. piscium]AZC76178.1 hypothetical protein C4K31_3275 [Pseudomonas chlororaphis subsp. piscium]AZC95987.1 hypothetical protein C4K28_3259 [Pseudomonas chlororaphis subsp. piscium]
MARCTLTAHTVVAAAERQRGCDRRRSRRKPGNRAASGTPRTLVWRWLRHRSQPR